jgi:hypothetical protein
MSSTPILNQLTYWECAGFSILWALIRMRPDTDHAKIARELIEEDGNSFTLQIASKWFVKKWYIKGIRPCTYSTILLKRQPIITWFTNFDWEVSGKPPYKMTFQKRVTLWSHYVIIDKPGRCANSAWDSWWDHGYFYFDQSQIKSFKQMFTLVL